MLGWVAATNEFGIEAGFLFMIQFFWQFPHFWSIGWLQFEEYKKAGFIMLPMDKKDQSATKQIIFYTVIMILVSVAPVLKTDRSVLYTSNYCNYHSSSWTSNAVLWRFTPQKTNQY